ncbi:hypothetical protein CO051_05595 [Candidatus Roizmanbacteria bacterium CG_4_9_14_0_2_um_filter_39_13]|uniref:Glycosyltransferase RgtA/B/C/D-like domain-containing protein n=2 Tax=Candidatus Roizmaniibacteriota TaxID=1752723 RepID=A0A2M8EX85_9BACT|nr:MAG: hypothetical protein COY15_04805 [Candidatus Roizmanbacteria bacterium CG_4_10_14_0_2_um_filter_39_12]PJC30459.1 MAG: hypothetical protein CO051_05595 [Candidatus Roizmanbacteria bacterium CG_4_9_14_0_2_um_filter_39_13]PJE61659.1 MAG: hypothetical protein COU87_03415 [Candidatus Roizmanbacteria bacterium CG10_big_fil_rev_8_21_14_0_10_39_12]
MNRRAHLYALIIFFFALLVRIVFLDSIPGNINPDAIDTLRTYIWDSSHATLSPVGFNWNGASAINTIIIGTSWKLFGESIFGLRLPSALFSSLSIAVVFYLGYMITKNLWLTFAFALATATNSWFLNFSRSGWENVWNSLSVMLIALGLNFFISKRLYKAGSLLVGVGSLLGLYFYHPGKMLFPVAMLILFVYSIAFKANKLSAILYLFITVFAVSILFIPQFISIVQNPETATNRISTVSINNHYDVSPSEQIKRNLIGFSLFRPQDFNFGSWSRYISDQEYPIYPIITLLYWLGIIVSLIKFPYLSVFYLLSILPVELLSQHTPDAARAVHIVPMIFLFALIGCSVLIDWLDKFLQSKSTIWKLLPTATATCFVIVVAFFQLSWYFSWIQKSQTLESRQPAIWLDEYDIWETDISYFIEKDKNYNIDEWRDIKNTNYGISD